MNQHQCPYTFSRSPSIRKTLRENLSEFTGLLLSYDYRRLPRILSSMRKRLMKSR